MFQEWLSHASPISALSCLPPSPLCHRRYLFPLLRRRVVHGWQRWWRLRKSKASASAAIRRKQSGTAWRVVVPAVSFKRVHLFPLPKKFSTTLLTFRSIFHFHLLHSKKKRFFLLHVIYFVKLNYGHVVYSMKLFICVAFVGWEFQLYKSLIGPDGWCIHYEKSTRKCSIYPGLTIILSQFWYNDVWISSVEMFGFKSLTFHFFVLFQSVHIFAV